MALGITVRQSDSFRALPLVRGMLLQVLVLPYSSESACRN